MDIPFYKYHALGNDYIVIDPNKLDHPLSWTPEKIKLICHRHYGIGSDGILYGPAEKSLSLQIFNPDGSEAEKSGNGIRIFARYLFDLGYVSKEKPFELETKGGVVQVAFVKNSDLIKVNMGHATFKSDKIPVKGPSREVVNEELTIGEKKYRVTCVSVGNPHCVIPLPKITEKMTRKMGPLVENHDQFPNRINMQLVKVVDRNTIQIQIWERGAGYTLASGSSSCASAAAVHRLGLVDKKVTVQMPGGQIEIEILKNNKMEMTGPVTFVAHGVLSPAFAS